MQDAVDVVMQAAREHELANALTVAEATVGLLALAPPDVGGIDTVRALRQALHTVRRLATTGGADTPAPRGGFELGALLDGAVLLASARGLQADVVRPAAVQVAACPGTVHQVVLNLLVNALHHGGARVRIVVTPGLADVEVAVVDGGPGLPPPVAASLWRGSPTPTMPQGPNGMGLALSMRMARAQGGDLWAERCPDGGAAVVLSLPLLASAELGSMRGRQTVGAGA